MEKLIQKNPPPRAVLLYYPGRLAAQRTHLFLQGSSLGAKLFMMLFATLLSVAAHAQLQRPTVQLDLVYTTQATNAAFPTISSDATFVYFEAGATTDFDGAFDATKFPNSTGLNLSSLTVPIPSTIPSIPTNKVAQLSINGLPPSLLAAPYIVKLYLGVPAFTSPFNPGASPPSPLNSYTLTVSQLSFFTSTQVFLVDSISNASVPLAPGTTYSFEATAANTNNTYTTRRFSLLFEPTGTLPVTLTSFTAQAQPPGVALAWHTANEQNSAYFAIERSANGQSFTEIGRVAAAGTSKQGHGYTFYDPQPLGGTGYYRLRQVDTDGTFQHSPVRAVGGQTASERLSLFPNPAHAGTVLRGAAPGTQLQVLNSLGQVVTKALVDASGTVALPATLPSGIYIVRSGQQSTRLVVN